MKRRVLALCAALVVLVCAGCVPSAEKSEGESGWVLWFAADLSENAVSAAALDSCPYEGAQTVPALFAALAAGPEGEEGLSGVIPAGTRLLSWTLSKGILTLDLSRTYGDLVGVDLTLADYCITLTMSQLPGVSGVRITVNGSDLPYRSKQIFYAGDVVFSGAEEEPVELSAALYFPRTQGGEPGFEARIFRLTESESPTLAVLEALLAGPTDPDLLPLFAGGLSIYSARVDDGVCYADFSARLLESVPEGETEQRLVLQCLVRTLCSLEGVQGVQLMVEGESLGRYGGVDVSRPLTLQSKP